MSKVIPIENGQTLGLLKLFHDNGKLYMEGKILPGYNFHGKFVSFDSFGRKNMECMYYNDLLHGYWTRWYYSNWHEDPYYKRDDRYYIYGVEQK